MKKEVIKSQEELYREKQLDFFRARTNIEDDELRFFRGAVAKYGELELSDDFQGDKGPIKRVCFGPLKGTKGLENWRACVVSFDKVRISEVGKLEFHVVHGGILYEDNSWLTELMLTCHNDGNELLLLFCEYIMFPKNKAVVSVCESSN